MTDAYSIEQDFQSEARVFYTMAINKQADWLNACIRYTYSGEDTPEDLYEATLHRASLKYWAQKFDVEGIDWHLLP